MKITKYRNKKEIIIPKKIIGAFLSDEGNIVVLKHDVTFLTKDDISLHGLEKVNNNNVYVNPEEIAFVLGKILYVGSEVFEPKLSNTKLIYNIIEKYKMKYIKVTDLRDNLEKLIIIKNISGLLVENGKTYILIGEKSSIETIIDPKIILDQVDFIKIEVKDYSTYYVNQSYIWSICTTEKTVNTIFGNLKLSEKLFDDLLEELDEIGYY